MFAQGPVRLHIMAAYFRSIRHALGHAYAWESGPRQSGPDYRYGCPISGSGSPATGFALALVIRAVLVDAGAPKGSDADLRLRAWATGPSAPRPRALYERVLRRIKRVEGLYERPVAARPGSVAVPRPLDCDVLAWG